ncbi:MAG: hypothetical protein AAF673_00485 [Pseudomonadota bacterium]
MNRPEFAIIAKCSGNEKDFKKWRRVTNMKKFHQWLITNYPEWKFYNVYDKRSKAWLECIKKPQDI